MERSALDRLKDALGKKIVKALHRQKTENTQAPVFRSQATSLDLKKNKSMPVKKPVVHTNITERDSRDTQQ